MNLYASQKPKPKPINESVECACTRRSQTRLHQITVIQTKLCWFNSEIELTTFSTLKLVARFFFFFHFICSDLNISVKRSALFSMFFCMLQNQCEILSQNHTQCGSLLPIPRCCFVVRLFLSFCFFFFHFMFRLHPCVLLYLFSIDCV